MTRRTLRLVPGLVAVAALIVGAMPAPAASVQWQTDMAKGFALARKLKKPVVIDFYTDWCGWCKRMDTDTYAHPQVAQLSRKFVMIKANAEVYKRAAEFYHVEGYPTIVFTDSAGREVDRVGGYRPAQPFYTTMRASLTRVEALQVLARRNRNSRAATARR